MMNETLKSRLSLGTEIGSGFFGSVYEGLDPVLGRVAVKILRRTAGESEDDWSVRKQNLLKEGQTLKESEHNNVVRVYQVLESQDDDSIYLVMEFCENSSLEGKYKSGPMQLCELRSTLCDVALGLQAIHSRGMIHRDIKPANILISSSGRAKVGDFGLVADNFVLGYAEAVGYLDHLAKETFDLGITSIRTDIWALGMTAYRLLHGKKFYEELPSPRLLVQDGGFASKLPWLPHIPNQWRRFVRQLMHDDPDSRFQNAVEVLRGLEALPIFPDWNCLYLEDTVSWTREKDNRHLRVTWNKHSPRRHSWSAESSPKNGNGRKRSLGGSNGIVGLQQAQKGLRKFFEGSF